MADCQPPQNTAADAPRRRRRRPQPSPVEVVPPQTAAPGPAPAPAPPAAVQPSRWQRWKREKLYSFGLSPTFRAYLFVGSLLAILAFLLYNESIIQELQEQEKRNVDLYATLTTLISLAPDAQSIAIFQEISINPNINFPNIVTDHQGHIIGWKNVTLDLEDQATGVARLWNWLAFWRKKQEPVAGDTSAATMAALRQLIEEMDATNEPKAFFQIPEVTGHLYSDGRHRIITDSQGEIVDWLGGDLPTLPDTTRAVRQQVEARLRQLQAAGDPLVFKAPVGALSHLYYDGPNTIIADSVNAVLAWQGPDLPASTDTTRAARQQVEARLRQLSRNAAPLSFEIPAQNYIHYGDSALIRRISRSTFVLTGVLLLFLLVGYIGFRNIKRSEQRSIWVGMARETAHQLGTPLSSLAGWLELIRHEIEAARQAAADPHYLARLEEMAGEMQKDMQRLTQIASRFSQIGSVPELQLTDVVALLQETVVYFRNRGAQFGRYQIHCAIRDPVPLLPLNPDLMSWVFENLFKNAIDAIDGPMGTIQVHVGLLAETRAVRLTFQDDGRGIAPEHLGRIFAPGFSTKKRGWGLGLAFVKRIVEEYHNGRISLVHSAPGQGTTFEVILPLAPPVAGGGNTGATGRS